MGLEGRLAWDTVRTVPFRSFQETLIKSNWEGEAIFEDGHFSILTVKSLGITFKL